MAIKFFTSNQTTSATSEFIRFTANGNKTTRLVQLLGTDIGGGTVDVEVAPIIDGEISSADAKVVHTFTAITDEPKVANCATDYAVRIVISGAAGADLNGCVSA